MPSNPKQRHWRTSTDGCACKVCGVRFCAIFYSRGKPKRLSAGAAACSRNCLRILKKQYEQRRVAALPRGAAHPAWKGGIGKTGKRGADWKKRTEGVREKQNYRCADCGRTEQEVGRSLDVHHKIPFHNFPSSRIANKPINLVGLCRACHGRAEAAVEYRQLSLGLIVGGRAIRPGKARGERSGQAKLREEQILEMRNLRANGMPIASLMAKFDMPLSCVQDICRGKSWKHVAGPRSWGRRYDGSKKPAVIVAP